MDKYYFKRFETRDNYDWLDFSALESVMWRDPFTEIGLDHRLKYGGNKWNGICPFHHADKGSFVADDKRKYYRCRGCVNPIAGNMTDFVFRIMGFDTALMAEIWLLQFDPKQRARIDVTFGRDLQAISARARERIESIYDPVGYRERRLHQRIYEELKQNKHYLLLELVATFIEDNSIALARMSQPDLRTHLRKSVACLAKKRAQKNSSLF